MESSDADGAPGAGKTDGTPDFEPGAGRAPNCGMAGHAEETPPPPPRAPAAHPEQGQSAGGGAFFNVVRNVFAGCGCGCLCIVVLFFASALATGVTAAKGLGKALEKGAVESAADEMGEDEYPYFNEIWSTGKKGSPKFVRIPITGKIDLSESGSAFIGNEEGTAAFALDAIRAATCDSSVGGLILEIDSPGGGVTDSDIIYNALMKFREAGPDQIVVVLMGDMCASGGYYIASAANYVMAHPTSTLGSIGVIIDTLNVKELADRLGVKDQPIASGKNKSMGGLFGDINDEQKAMLQGIVDASYDRFVEIVANGRDLPVEKVREIADGSIFSAKRGVELKLVDGIGYYDDAVDAICDMIRSDSIYVVRYETPLSFGKVRSLRKFIGGTLLRELESASTPRKAYLFGK